MRFLKVTEAELEMLLQAMEMVGWKADPALGKQADVLKEKLRKELYK
jgi:hypothetical protein